MFYGKRCDARMVKRLIWVGECPMAGRKTHELELICVSAQPQWEICDIMNFISIIKKCLREINFNVFFLWNLILFDGRDGTGRRIRWDRHKSELITNLGSQLHLRFCNSKIYEKWTIIKRLERSTKYKHSALISKSIILS